ncbi:MAG: VCBS repeat-containing protein, partial [Sulfurovum sp.]|nr:VCBS repeat-containing protein [Sulfurovaceae bacterium]
MNKLKYVICMLSILVFFSACNNSSNNIEDSDSYVGEHTRMSESSMFYHQKLDFKLQSSIDAFLVNERAAIVQEVESTSANDEFNLTREVTTSIVDAIESKFKREVQKDFTKSHTRKIATEYLTFNKNINIEDAQLRSSSLEAHEKESISTLIDDYFFQNSDAIYTLFNNRLEQVIEYYFPSNSNSSFRSTMTLNSSSNDSTLTRAAKVNNFKNKIKAYFPDFNASNDKKKINTSKHFYDKLQITNTFNGATLFEHIPEYLGDGTLNSVKTKEHSVTFPSIDDKVFPKNSGYYLATSAYIQNNSEPSLLIFKQYHNQKYYAYELTHEGILSDLHYAHLAGLTHVTDVVSANIDDDAKSEFVVALGSPENKIIIFDDAGHKFHKITEYYFQEGTDDRGIIRVAAGDTNGDGYDEIAAVIYDEEALSWHAKMKMWDIVQGDDTAPILKERFSHRFASKTPVDLTFSDLYDVDTIELFAVQISPKIVSESQGHEQPSQSGPDDYCRYYAKATNTLFVYNFNKGDSSVEKKEVEIANYTYGKHYESGEVGNEDGVWCNIFGSCTCSGASGSPYPLYSSYETYYPRRATLWKPIYITPYHTTLDKPASLDIDGIGYDFFASKTKSTIKPAKKYKEGRHYYSFNGHKNYYTPVSSNSSESKNPSNSRAYVTKMTEGQRHYAFSPNPRSISSVSITTPNLKGFVYRQYSSTAPNSRRLSSFG